MFVVKANQFIQKLYFAYNLLLEIKDTEITVTVTIVPYGHWG
jgi:hypothetical protein